MKFIQLNLLPIILALLSCYMVYAHIPYYGWIIVAAILVWTTPKTVKD